MHAPWIMLQSLGNLLLTEFPKDIKAGRDLGKSNSFAPCFSRQSISSPAAACGKDTVFWEEP